MAPRSKNNLNLGFGMDVSELKNGFADAIKALKKDGKVVESEAQNMAASLVASMKKIEGATTLKQASRQMQNLVGQMHAFGLEGTAAFRETAKAAGNLQAELDDVSGFIKAARPDAPFQALTTTLHAGAQAFAGIQGAMALFGTESEDLQKTLLKVQAAMAFAEGFKALDGLQDGFKQLKNVILQNPLISGAAILLTVTAGITAWANATSDLTRQTKLMNDVQGGAIKIAEEEYGKVTALSAIILDETQSRKARNEALKTLKELYPENNKLQTAEIGNLGQLKTAIDEVTKSIVQRATVESAFNKLKEIGNRFLQAELDFQNDLRDNAKRAGAVFTGREENMSPAAIAAAMEKSDKILKDNSKKRFDNARAIIQKDYDDLLGFLRNQNEDVLKSVIGDIAPKGKGGKKVDRLGGKEPGDFMLAPQNMFFSKTQQDEIASTSEELSKYNLGLSHANDAVVLLSGSQDTLTKGMQEFKPVAVAVGQSAEETAEKIKKTQEEVAELNARFKQLKVDVTANMAAAFAEAAVSGENVADALGNALFNTIGDFMVQLGRAMIAVGVSFEAFKKSLESMQPEIALIAGIGLVAAGSALKAIASKGPGFAEGGIIGGASFSGDKLLAPVNSGEMVFNRKQQNELLSIANGQSGSMALPEPKVIFNGKDLLLAFEYANKEKRRW